MKDRGRAPLSARFVACVAACLLIGTALALMGALAVWALRLLIAGMVALAQMAAGGVAA